MSPRGWWRRKRRADEPTPEEIEEHGSLSWQKWDDLDDLTLLPTINHWMPISQKEWLIRADQRAQALLRRKALWERYEPEEWWSPEADQQCFLRLLRAEEELIHATRKLINPESFPLAIAQVVESVDTPSSKDGADKA